MIRAAIGRFVMACIKAAHEQRFHLQTRDVDFSQLTEDDISNMIHGRAIDLTRPRFHRGEGWK